MWSVTLKGLVAHRVRLLLTATAIVLGVAFVAGTFVLTDTLKATFDRLFKQVDVGTDAVVRSRRSFAELSQGINTNFQPMPVSVLDQVRAVRGVAEAEGGVSGTAVIVDKGGKAIIPFGPPTLGFNFGQKAALSAYKV